MIAAVTSEKRYYTRSASALTLMLRIVKHTVLFLNHITLSLIHTGSPFFEFLRLNHIGHHVASGRSNYNVCCPGMDHLVGKP